MKWRTWVEWGLYAIAIGYLFLPTDLIPDVPIVGMIDDAAVFLASILINKVIKFGK